MARVLIRSCGGSIIRPNRLLCVDAGDEGVGFGGDDVVDVGLQLLVDCYCSLTGGGERGSAGAVALDELAA